MRLMKLKKGLLKKLKNGSYVRKKENLKIK